MASKLFISAKEVAKELEVADTVLADLKAPGRAQEYF